MRIFLFLLLFSIILIFGSCSQNQIKFNEKQWKTRDDISFNHRALMIEDLTKNYLKLGQKYEDLEKILGTQDLIAFHDSLQLQYEIYTDYGYDIDPVETKTLILNFNKDSTFVSFRIDHWKK